ncbi:MAG TPA: outer membrane beta-barrel protein, partial [Chthonomonadaceae bacterium]|nr:outer membrane beta-barrel protein [Chthonomonadaceae bacterium]
MNCTNDRAPQSGSRTGCAAGVLRLATSDTVSNATPKARAEYPLRRTLLPLLTLAAIGLGAVTAGAQDTPKKDDKKTDKAVAAAQPAPAPAAPAAPAPGTVTLTGLIDGYYQENFQHPGTKGKSTFAAPFAGLNATRSFDYRDGFALSLAELNVTRTAGKGFPLGITATLTAFDTPPVVYANEPHGTPGFEGVQQLYLTWSPHALNRDWAIDFGKFVTPFGNEVIESVNNDEYSRGLVFQYAVPFYHTGIRAAAPLTKSLNMTLGLVTGWNSTNDDNGDKSGFLQLNWTANSRLGIIANFMTGKEGTGAYGKIVAPGTGEIDTNLYEVIPTININSKFKIAGDVVYGDGAGSVAGAHVSGKWLGMAAYARYQWTPRIATAARLEQFEDMPGAGALPGNAGGGLRLGGGYAKLNSFTATLEYLAFHGKLVSRLEYRH